MAGVTELTFSKVWTDPEDFPTHESDEETVRSDIQYLFDELKNYLNQTVVAKLNGLNSEDVAVETGGATSTLDQTLTGIERSLSQIQQDLENVVLGQIPDNSLTRDKLRNSIITPNKISTLETVDYDDTPGDNARWAKILYPTGWVYNSLTRCLHSAVAGTHLETIGFNTLVKIPQTYDPDFSITVSFEENAPAAILSSLDRAFVQAKAMLNFDYRVAVDQTGHKYRFRITIPQEYYDTYGENGSLPSETFYLYFSVLIA